MKNAWRYDKYCYRRPHIHQELVANCELREEKLKIKWGRNRRNRRYLDPWVMEKSHGFQKSWKKYRHTQYRLAGTRSETNKHIVYIKCGWYNFWALEQYFRKNNIPYRIDTKRKSTNYIIYQYTKRQFVGYVPHYYLTSSNKQKSYSIPKYIDIPLDKPIKHIYRSYKIIGHIITWWSDKNINIWRLLNVNRICER